MKIAVYTAIIGEYEAPREPIFRDDGIDYILFTDKKTESQRWDVRYLAPCGLTARKSARCVKILSHEYLPDYDLTIWVDANFCQKKSLMPLIKAMTGDITLLKHPSRKCIFDEAKACIEQKHDYPEVIEDQMYYYQVNGYPLQNGLVATGLILRKNTPEIQKLNDDWWYEVLGKSGRDQLSFDFVSWINDICPQKIPFETLYEYFEHSKHRKERRRYESNNKTN